MKIFSKETSYWVKKKNNKMHHEPQVVEIQKRLSNGLVVLYTMCSTLNSVSLIFVWFSKYIVYLSRIDLEI